MAKSSILTRKGVSSRAASRARRHMRVRKKVAGTTERPRLVVSRSSKHIGAQIIDDTRGHTLAAASTLDPTVRDMSGEKTEKSRKVGELLSQRAREAGITSVVFDRGGYKYHGRVAALADSARAGGLEF